MKSTLLQQATEQRPPVHLGAQGIKGLQRPGQGQAVGAGLQKGAARPRQRFPANDAPGARQQRALALPNQIVPIRLIVRAVARPEGVGRDLGAPVPAGGGFTFDPIIDARLRYEGVDTPTLDADAATLRVRAGAELKHKSGLSLLAEAEGTLAVISDYNAFPFVISDTQRRPGYAVVADPMNVELNRLQVQYKSKRVTVTLGRRGWLAAERADL